MPEALSSPKGGGQSSTIASFSGAPRYHSFRVKGRIGGQHIVALIDGGATHNFIDQGIAARFRFQRGAGRLLDHKGESEPAELSTVGPKGFIAHLP